MTSNTLITPCGDRLVDLRLAPDRYEPALREAARLPSIQLSDRAACDLELLATGGFSPLDRFMGRADFERVVGEMRLADGTLHPIPVTLTVPLGSDVHLDGQMTLRDSHNEILAILTLDEVYPWDRRQFAQEVLGTEDLRHPLVNEIQSWGEINLSGRLEVLALPRHYDFADLRLAPSETRARLTQLGRRDVVAFQTRNPLHRVHEELTKRAAQSVDGVLLLHPVVGMTKPGDVDHYTRVRTYRAMAERYFDPGRILLTLLPLAMRLAGPREALWHALIRRNYGANYLIVGRDHASPGKDSQGRPFYDPYAAQELVSQHRQEIGIGVIPFREFVYLPEEDRYEEESRVDPGLPIATISGTQVREDYLDLGRPLPTWFTRPEVAEILSETYPPRHRQGACVWFTGLSGAGKSTTAEALTIMLLERGRQVTLLDGDVVRTHLSKGLGFGREDRDANIRRIGFVASEIVRHGGVAICAAVSPFRATRDAVRLMVGSDHFVEVFVDTPLDVCEARDGKGMYAKARRGEIRGFTGIDDPYEPPEHPELVLETILASPESNARKVLEWLKSKGFVRDASEREAGN